VGNGQSQPTELFPSDVIGLSTGVAKVVGGFDHTCALMQSGGVKCWGSNRFGQLGDGTSPYDPYVVPVDSSLTSGVTAIALGHWHTCALMVDQTVRCWGDDQDGQLGNNASGLIFPNPTTVGQVTSQSITLASLPARDVKDAPFTVTATASSGLPVTITSLTPSICGVSGSTVTLAAIGICTVAANQSGDNDYAAAPQVARSFLVSGLTTASPTRLANISTRLEVLTGYDIAIGGFVIGGLSPKTVVVRAIGPSLANYGVANPLANPKLQLYFGQNPIRANDDWTTGASAATIQAIGLAPSDARESAMLLTLQPGAYTAVMSSLGGTGVALVEIYEIDREDIPLINISTRGHVGTDFDVMIGGFVITGNSPQTVVVTAKGPTLGDYGIPSPLANPTLTLVRQSDQSIVATNDDWGSASNAADVQASGFAPSNALESAILVTLPPGAYTAIVSGVNGGTGTGIVEVYATQ
jgi:hypothetical protein